ncbi:hypothetical protein AB834_04770 [PVC group bacterium (ex Bugula neritina AB1)]|nr:hypothetical protein AB834_04770 [PVC group bacterium (ex Bugula neritina AB1)]
MYKFFSKNILLFFVIFFIAWVIFLQRYSTKASLEASETFKIDHKNILGFNIQNPKERHTIRRVSEGDQWKLITPYRADVEQGFFDQFSQAFSPFSAGTIVKRDLSKKDLEMYGLKDASSVFTVVTSKDNYALMVGDMVMVENAYYAKWKHLSYVFLLRKEFFSYMFRSPSNIQKTSLFSHGLDNLEKVKWIDSRFSKLGTQTFEIIKKDKKWKSTQPFQEDLNTSKVEKMLDYMFHLGFDASVFDKEVDWKNPFLEIECFFKGRDKSQRLIFAPLDKEKQVYPLKTFASEKTHALKKDVMNRLIFNPYDMFQKKIFPFNIEEVTKMEIWKQKKLDWAVKQDNLTWKIYKKEEHLYNPNIHFLRFLSALNNGLVERYHGFLNKKKDILVDGKILLTLKVFSKKGEQWEYVFYKKGEKLFLIWDSYVLNVLESFLDYVTMSFDDFLEKGSPRVTQ